MEGMARSIVIATEQMMAAAQQPVKRIELIDKQRAAQLQQFHTVALAEPRYHYYFDGVERFAQEQPDRMALIACDAKLTYQELNTAANRMANGLLARGVKPRSKVALLLPRTSRVIISMYGVTKVSGELLSNYYFTRFGVDTRSVRFPGLISYVTPPGGGTTDYAVDIYYSAVKGEKFKCPIKAGTFMDMMYMPDALRAAIEIMEADPQRLVHRNSFNIASMSFDPEIIYNCIKKYIPDFEMEYEFDPLRQGIADSWPNKLDDTCARIEWDWKPEYDLDSMTRDMIEKLKVKFGK